MYGETVSDLMLYLAPVSGSSLADFGYDNTNLQKLLDEKADLVFSYLPRKYRRLYTARVYRLILVAFCYAGQVAFTKPFPAMTNLVGYKNPSEDLKELKDAENIVITDAGATLTFPALAKGDLVVIDFSNDMSAVSVPPLAWATKVLAAIDILKIFTGETKSGALFPRIKEEAERVFPWLESLNNFQSPGDRHIVRRLEYSFYEGGRNFAKDLDDISRFGVEQILI